ncbi:MAG: hypothetical protein IPN34_20290 [Planctomycetes bacterium]|nr:hypothetical protein [Planctomycetota bacterium]
MNHALLLALALLAGTCSAQETPLFRAAPAATPWPERTRVLVHPRTEYSIDGGRLVRRVDGGATEQMLCTLPEGPGTVRRLSSEPTSATYVLAERGLFIIDPSVVHLDPVERTDGFPEGLIVGADVDGQRRLWIATRDAFACVDTRQFFARVFEPGSEVPPGPYEDVAVRDDGRVLLRAASGLFVYRPDAQAPPRCRVVRAAGNAWSEATRVELAADGRLELEVEREVGCTLRYRSQRHHLWYPLDLAQPVITGLEPGEHALEIASFDRDLRSSTPVIVRVHVPVPKRFAKRTLSLFGCGAAALLALVLAFCARRSPPGPIGTRGVVWVLSSTALVLGIGLQILAAIVPHARAWPFVGFTMYTEVYREGERVYQPALLAHNEVATWELDLTQAGLHGDGAWPALLPLVHGTAEAKRAFVERYAREKSNSHLRGYSVVSQRRVLTARGPIAVAPLVTYQYSAEETR